MKIPGALLKEFIASLSGKAGTTVDAYQRELRHFLDWISQRAGNSAPFNTQQQLTKTALQTYLSHLQSKGHSISHCARVKSAVRGFARWLSSCCDATRPVE
ncbi:MAG: site-specific integrase [Chthoniobacterales bacterium]